MADVYNPGANFRPRSPWGDRIDPFDGTKKFHSGQDFAAAAGTPIPSATGTTRMVMTCFEWIRIGKGI